MRRDRFYCEVQKENAETFTVKLGPTEYHDEPVILRLHPMELVALRMVVTQVTDEAGIYRKPS